MTTTLTKTLEETPERQRDWRGAGVGTQIAVLTARSLRKFVTNPRLIVFSLLQPLIMLLLFSQVFGKAIVGSGATAGGSYINYLMPAILVTTGIGASLQSGVGLISDSKNGVLARFRSLPIQLSTVLVARSLSDLVRTAVQLGILLVFAAVLFGFSPTGGFAGVTASLLLALAVSWALTWVFLAIAAWLRNEESMQTVGFLAMFPLMFASSAFVPLASLPTWLKVVATINPLTYAVDASRNLSLALPVHGGVISALAASAALAVVGIAFAVRGFRRPA
ncbi:ABC transporter permease [Fodinicola acaciae]|uniref:ABC transporter permease n=1 Tax=Fodinicola acaciae TaxID=2681555 RepID=UPI0013D41EE7|nr:ABC transporter permease [Fodinicola acaciae]